MQAELDFIISKYHPNEYNIDMNREHGAYPKCVLRVEFSQNRLSQLLPLLRQILGVSRRGEVWDFLMVQETWLLQGGKATTLFRGICVNKCICEGNLRSIIKHNEELFDNLFLDNDNILYNFKGIVYAKDDFYYLLIDMNGNSKYYSCVGTFEDYGLNIVI